MVTSSADMGEFRGVLGKLAVKPVTLPLCWVLVTAWHFPVTAPFIPVRQRQRKAANEATPTGPSPRALHVLSEGMTPWEYPAQPTSASPKLKEALNSGARPGAGPVLGSLFVGLYKRADRQLSALHLLPDLSSVL